MSNKEYTTSDKIIGYLGDIEVFGGIPEYFIVATQSLIDQMTNRNFKADAEASTRLFNGNDKDYLIIDDCVDVTKVEVGQDSWGDDFTEVGDTGSDRYYLLPTNYEQDGLPIRKIGLRTRIWGSGHANHRITAKWGFSSEVPADISFAATVLASGMYYQNRGENTGQVKSEKIGQYSVSYADAGGFDDMQKAMEILQGYKKYMI